MKTEFLPQFYKDIEKITVISTRESLKRLIIEVESVKGVADIRNIKKIKGLKTYYRIRIGDYRVGVMITRDTVLFMRFVNRKDIYKVFP